LGCLSKPTPHTKWFCSVLLLLKSDLDFSMRKWSFDFKTGIRPLIDKISKCTLVDFMSSVLSLSKK
jgi:hypothetical protein